MTLLADTEEIIFKLEVHAEDCTRYLEEITEIEDWDLIFTYLTDAEPFEDNELFTGSDICGNQYTHTFKLPDYITKPPEYNSSSTYYLYSGTGLAFDKHTHDYLVTLDISTILEACDSIEKERRLDPSNQKDLDLILLRFLTSKASCQSRIANIWRQSVAACVAYQAIWRQENPGAERKEANLIKRMFSTLIKHLGKLPFRETQKSFVWEREIKAPTILPLLIYAIQNLVTQRCAGTVKEIEMVLAFQYYLDCGVSGYQDTKLKKQKMLRNWLREGLLKFSKIIVPHWDSSGMISRVKEKQISPLDLEIQEVRKARQKREESLQDYILKYIDHALLKARSLYQVHQYWQVTRVIANDGTYFASEPALTLNQAVRPRVQNTAVKYPSSQFLTMRREPIPVMSIADPDSQVGCAMQYASQYINRVAQKLNDTNFQEAFVTFLTSSSSGKDFEEIEISRLTKVIQKIAKMRIVAAGIESRGYLRLDFIDTECSTPSKLVGRTQIGRRQRAVAGVNNTRSLMGFPPLRILETQQKMTGCASSGKQLGNYLDLLQTMCLSSLDNIYYNSADVDAMDASVQAAVQQVMWSYVTLITMKMAPKEYFAFHSGKEVVYKNLEDGRTEEVPMFLSGLSKACLSASKVLQPQNSVIEDDIVGSILTREPTFPSGLPFTNVHHTFILTCAIKGRTEQEEKKSGVPSTLNDLKVQGDDIKVTNFGSRERVNEFIEKQQNYIQEWGFEVTNENSSYSCEFLQQRVSCGMFVGYCDRVSLFTSERQKEGKTLQEKSSEIQSLCTDLGCRARSPQGLVPLMYSIMLVCCGRLTINAKTKLANQFADSDVGKLLRAKVIVRKDNPENGLLRYYYPLSAFWLEEGAQLPPLKTFRNDETSTPFPSYYFQRGRSNRYWLWDISYTQENWEKVEAHKNLQGTSAHIFLDYDVLEKYQVRESLISLQLNKTKQMEEIRLENTSTIYDIETLAEGLNAYRNHVRMAVSEHANNYLSAHGYELPDSVVYSRHIQSRIKDAILKAKITEKEAIEMSKMYPNIDSSKQSLMELIKPHKSDIMMLHRCEWGDRNINRSDQLIEILSTVPLSMEVYPNSDAATLTCYTGIKGAQSSQLTKMISLFQGKYGTGRISELQFKQALRMYSLAPELFPEFIKACGLGDEAELAIRHSLSAYDSIRGVDFPTVHTPRQYFFGIDTGASLQEHIDYVNGVPMTQSEQAGYLLMAMRFLGSNSVTACGKSIRVIAPVGVWSDLKRL
ncbi:polymerase [Taro reovirus 1]|nr:polymerase [Taro reovirus 1]